MSAFAVFCATDGSLIFYNRDTVPSAGSTFEGKTVSNVYTGFDTVTSYTNAAAVPWDNERASIISVSFMPEFATIKLKTARYLFASASNMVSFSTANLDTSDIVSMYSMFNGCSSLTSLDLSNFDTSSATDMGYMFRNCLSLTSLDLSNFDTSKVTSMTNMFYSCSKLTSLDLSNFNTSNVTAMNEMFGNCRALTSLDISNFDTSKVTNMSSMFYYCNKLLSLDLGSFDTSNVTNMSTMFNHCDYLVTIDISNFNTSKVTNMGSMFNGCDNLTSIYVSALWTTSAVTNSANMFGICSKLVGAIPFNSSVVDKTHANYETGYLTYKFYFANSGNRYVVSGSDLNKIASGARIINDSLNGMTIDDMTKTLSNIRKAKGVQF